MKTLEFKTSKGEFILVDGVYHEGIKLSEITEDKASEIVSSSMGNKNFLLFTLKQKGVYLYDNPFIKPKIPNEQTLKKFHNKGYGENDFVDLKYDQHMYDLAEQKTFYNPYLFKKK